MAPHRKPTLAEIEASQWIARIQMAGLSSGDQQKFETWLAASQVNRLAYEGLSQTYKDLGVLEGMPQLLPERRPVNRRGLIVGIAAVAAVSFLALVLPPLLRPGQHQTILTPVGGRAIRVLSDGTRVELGAASRLQVAFTPDQRHVQLSEGEALFDVSANPARPFIVDTPRGQILVHGTAFLIEINPDNVRTTVLRGVVEGRADRFPLQRLITSRGAGLIAHANEEIAFRDGRARLSALAPDMADRRLAWRQGALAFDGESLSDATAAITRQTGAHFEFASPDLADLAIGGYLPRTDVQVFLNQLHAGLGVDARETSPQHYLLRRNSAPTPTR